VVLVIKEAPDLIQLVELTRPGTLLFVVRLSERGLLAQITSQLACAAVLPLYTLPPQDP